MDIKAIYNNKEKLFAAMESQYSGNGRIPDNQVKGIAEKVIAEKYSKEEVHLATYLESMYINYGDKSGK